MGKANRIRTNRASAPVTTVKTPKKKKSMPSWALNLITITVAVVILVSVVVMAMSANGVFGRMSTAMKSENFRVSRNMMDYFFQTQYNSFVSDNSAYLQYFGLDTGASLKDQMFDTTTGSESTWFDYIMGQTEDQVKDLLIFCEEAKARGIELDEADHASIDAELSMYETYASIYGYDVDAYIAQMYGKGMKVKDIRAAMELSALASKCTTQIGTEITNSITDTDIESTYNADKRSFNKVDYKYFTFSVTLKEAITDVLNKDSYTDEEITAKKTEIIAKYKELIKEAQDKAKALTEAKDAKEFEKLVITHLVNDAWDSTYDSALEKSEVADDKVPSEAQTALIKDIVIDKVITHIADGLEVNSDKIINEDKLFGMAVDGMEWNEDYSKFLKDTVTKIYTTANTKLDTYNVEKASYKDTDDALEWAFGTDRKLGDTTTIETGDGADGAEMSDDTSKLKSFTVGAYFLEKSEYRDETPSKNVGIMVFSTKASAEDAIKKLTKGMTLEQFEALSNELNAGFTKYEDYTEGTMGVSAFDKWLFDEETTLGSFTGEVITVSNDSNSSAYAVALYYGDGTPLWKVTVKSEIFNDRYEALEKELHTKFESTIKTNESVLNNIDA